MPQSSLAVRDREADNTTPGASGLPPSASLASNKPLSASQGSLRSIDNDSWKSLIKEKKLLETFTIEKIPPLFPRVEEPLLEQAKPADTKSEEKKESKKEEKKDEGVALIGIDQFFQTSLKVGTVVAAEEVPKSKKLLLLQVDIGEEKPRQVVAGIKEWYSADDMLGTQVCVVANLKPAKLMGLKSEGMLLAAKDEDGLCMIRPEKPKKPGTPIS